MEGCMEPEELDRALAELRSTFRSGRTRSYTFRRGQLAALRRLLREEEEGIFRALHQDLGKHPMEAFRDEVGILLKSVDFALENLKKWMAPQKVHVPLVLFPSSGVVVPEPLGLVLIISSWNFPIGLSLEPLIGAISAGNVVVLKTSELALASSVFLAEKIPIYLDSKCVKVIEGGPMIGKQLLERKFDKIFFTGSAKVGRIVMAAAAEHLTPVTLELGGKCPALVDSISNLRNRKIAARRIFGGKWAPCFGQACIGIDYLLVEESFAHALVVLLKKTIEQGCKEYGDLSRVVNKQHFQRLATLLKDPAVKSTIVHGGSLDHENLKIEPTILMNPPLESDIMNEEIFGPFLPIITLKNIEDSIEFINDRPKPLAIYAFTHNEDFKRRLLAETSSGSVTFNDTMIQYAVDTLPFGGVGSSGFGKYHGKYSFDAFSHEKSVLKRSFLLEFTFRYPPWDEQKLQFMRCLYRFDYMGILLCLLGLKR